MITSAAEVPHRTVNGRVFHAVTAATCSAVVVKIAATFKEFAVARAFGRSDELEAFLAAAIIPGLLVNLVSESMNQALIPTLVATRERRGRAQAQKLLSNALVSTCVLLAGISAVMAVSARLFFPLIGSSFPKTKLELAVHLFYQLLPVILCSGVASICSAVLNTEGRYGLPAFAPIITPAVILVCVAMRGSGSAIELLVYASVFGAAVHALWMAGLMQRSGYRLRLHWYGMNRESKEVAMQFWPVAISSVVASGGILVDQAMAAMLPAGSLAALAYGGRFVSVALALMAGPLSAAMTLVFSEMVAHEDWMACRRMIRAWSIRAAMGSVGVTLMLVIGARLLVRITFQHGAFGAEDTSAVSAVLMMYALQIPFFVSSRVFYRFLVAMRRTDLVLYCGIVNLVLDVLLNLMLIRWLGVAGIALATSLWSASTLVFLGYCTWRVLPRAEACLDLAG